MLAFVLGGGGGRGALQVGALRALLEANIRPDLLVGTSAGATNAAFVAVRGFTPESLTELEAAWRDATTADLLPVNYLWLTVRMLFNRPRTQTHHRMRDFFVEHGLGPDLRFGDVADPRLILVAADLNERRTVLYGDDPDQSVLEGLLASTTIPPWTHPLEVEDHLLMDGGAVSNLPIEPALAQGATEVIALDIADPRVTESEAHGFGPFVAKLVATVEQRQLELELALAEARGVPVHRIVLRAGTPVPLWDFSQPDALIAQGYEITRQEIAGWRPERRLAWREWLRRLWRRNPV
ncbi:MAG: patatin-like phospholipase family protein [Anaerolineae bacterium]